MKKLAILFIIILCAAAAALAYDETNFSALGRVYQPAPQGHTVGKDNGPGLGMHNVGEDCGKCHTMGGRAEARLWTAAGTLFADRSGKTPLKGGEVILQDRDGNVISMTSNQAGNFWTTAPIASNPYAVVSHGGPPEPLYTLDENGNLLTPADPMDLRTWQYKAWIKKGGAVRPMVTIAPVGGASGMDMRMSCSMHHAPMGSRGALWVSSAPTLPAYPATGLSYQQHIYPILRSKCAPCHIPGKTVTRQVTKSDIDNPSTSFDHSSGIDFTTYEGSTAGGVVKWGVESVVDPSDPANSLLLRKTLPGQLHGGGSFWNEHSPDYKALKQWISEGARKD